MNITELPEPVQKLINLGEPALRQKEWFDYSTLGLTMEHVPALIEVVRSFDDFWSAEELTPADYAPMHGWRALGQLKAEEAARPLAEVIPELNEAEDDWYLSDLPVVFGMIGPAAIPPLSELLLNEDEDLYSRAAAGTGLTQIAGKHEEARTEALAPVFGILNRRGDDIDPELNGFLVGDLLDFAFPEALPVIRDVFAAQELHEGIVGWDSIQKAYKIDEPHPNPDAVPPRPIMGWRDTNPFAPPADAGKKKFSRAKAKAKHKQQKASRKANRKKKKK